jgi:parvulin-like peptidyl-prolyl isomerase
MIDFVLVRQEGTAMGVSLSDEELEAEVEADIAAGGGQDAFSQWLEQTGQTAADYRQLLRELLWSESMLEVVTADLPTVAEQVHLRHIAVDSRDTAEAILAELQQGADFAELAQARSEDTMTQKEGGDLGWIPLGVIAPELERSAFALQVGEISDVISVGEGYHIIQVVEREADRPVAPDLQADLELAAFEQWLSGLRAAAVIERYVSE